MTQDVTPASGASSVTTPATPATPAAPVVTTTDPTPTPAPTTPAEPTPSAPVAPTDTTPPGDWASLRTQFAKGDEKLEKRLARYSSVEAALDALVAAQNKISSGVVKTPLPENATPEQVKEWRTENGIPTTVDDYDIKLSNGMLIGEDDKPYAEAFLNQALEAGLKSEQANKVLDWYFQDREAQMADLKQADAVSAQKAAEEMRKEWGTEYKLNFNLINGMLETAPEGVKDQVLGARLANGTPLGSDPAVLRWLATTARELNPTATVVPTTGSNAAATVEAELASIQKLMGDHKSDYWKGPSSERMQARYRELINVQQKLK